MSDLTEAALIYVGIGSLVAVALSAVHGWRKKRWW